MGSSVDILLASAAGGDQNKIITWVDKISAHKNRIEAWLKPADIIRELGPPGNFMQMHQTELPGLQMIMFKIFISRKLQ